MEIVGYPWYKFTFLAVTKVPNKSHLRRGCVEAHGMVEAQMQEGEAVGHLVSRVRKQRKPNC